MTGSYLSQERFADPTDGSDANDFSTISSRLYLKVYDLGTSHVEVTTDVRDKHDFFDKFDAERLQLVSGNTLQVFQLNARFVNPRKAYFGTLGRFLVMEAGGVPVDGVEAGYRWSMALRSGFFGGLNPKRSDQTYFTYNPDSQIAGFYLTYQPKDLGWSRNTYISQALIAEPVQGHLDRFYLYQNFVYQWAASNQWVGALYLDFVPRVNVQNGFLNLTRELGKGAIWTGGILAIDSIEFSRRKGVLTRLSPSTYREFNSTLQLKMNSNWSLNSNLNYGARGADGLAYADFSAGPGTQVLFDPHVSGQASLGGRHNFNTNEVYFKIDLGYFSKVWEVGLNLQKALSVQNYGVTYHPFIGELSLARYFSKEFYSTVSIEEAVNERVTIWSGFFKFGYRFGSEDVAPLRDGAPPRRRL